MRFYLSSFRFGNEAAEFTRLIGTNRRVALIAHADDTKDAELRAAGIERELASLADLGLEGFELDLRPHFGGDPQSLRRELEHCGAVWVRGGNTFVLRRALRLSGADALLVDLVRRDALVLGGYSAGICVLAPTLCGLEGADDPAVLPAGYEVASEPVWDGLGLLTEFLVPHVPRGEPAPPWIESIRTAYKTAGVPYRTLADGEALVGVGDDWRLVA